MNRIVVAFLILHATVLRAQESPVAVSKLGANSFMSRGEILKLVISNDGHVLLGLCGDGNLVIWDAITGQTLHSMESRGFDARSVIGGVEKTSLFRAVTHNGKVVIIDGNRGLVTEEGETGIENIVSGAMSADGGFGVFHTSRGQVYTFDFRVKKNRLPKLLWQEKDESMPLASLVISPDGAFFGVTTWGKTREAFIGETSTGAKRWDLSAEEGGCQAIGAEHILMANRKTCRLLSWQSRKEAKALTFDDNTTATWLSPDAKTWNVMLGGEAKIVDVATLKTTSVLHLPEKTFPRAYAVSHDRLYVSYQGWLRAMAIPIANDSNAERRSHHGEVRSISMAGWPRSVVTTGSDRTALVWRDGRVQNSVVTPSVPVVSPGGHEIAFQDGEETVIQNLEKGMSLRIKEAFLQFSSDDRVVCARSSDGKTDLLQYDQLTAKPIPNSLVGPAPELIFVNSRTPDSIGRDLYRRELAGAFSGENIDSSLYFAEWARSKNVIPDGSLRCRFSTAAGALVVADSFNGTIRAIEILTGREIWQRKLPDKMVVCGDLLISPRGTIAAGDGGGNLIFWNLLTGQERMITKAHRGAVTCLAFSNDGQHICSGGMDTLAIIWKLPPPQESPLKNLDEIWGRLGSDKTVDAYQAADMLLRGGEETTRFISKKLRPALRPEIDGQTVSRLAAGLADSSFQKRAAAERELIAMKDRLDVARAILSIQSGLQVQRSVQGLLPEFERSEVIDRLRELRAITILETMGRSAQIEEIAQGYRGAIVTKEALKALKRMKS